MNTLKSVILTHYLSCRYVGRVRHSEGMSGGMRDLGLDLLGLRSYQTRPLFTSLYLNPTTYD